LRFTSNIVERDGRKHFLPNSPRFLAQCLHGLPLAGDDSSLESEALVHGSDLPPMAGGGEVTASDRSEGILMELITRQEH
jgi:hypothetical protein